VDVSPKQNSECVNNPKEIILDEDFSSMRLDQALAHSFPEYSRAQLQGFIKSGQVLINNTVSTKQRTQVHAGDRIGFTPTAKRKEEWLAQDIPINVVYEDDDLLIVNKASPMVVHPGSGVYEDTLVNALLHHCPSLNQLPRAGLIHRLDKETTGLLVVAKTLEAHRSLTEQMQARSIKRIYQAVVQAPLVAGGTVDAPIARHPVARTKMAVPQQGGRTAVTHYRVKTRFRHHTHLQLQLETGRTHQIRVHMQHIRHPIVGDPTYSRLKIPRECTSELRDCLQNFNRQALHAFELALTHPATGERISWTAELPQDFQHLLTALENNET
jgi:23S rRNA pseudouridine1911/1915/1917 synthase